MTVDELAIEELNICNKVDALTGSAEEKTVQIKELGISQQYRGIHNEYAKLNKSDLEALKRGLFLIWYSRLEPSFLTGIHELDSDSENKIIKTLDRRLSQGIIDYELDWMIDYYSNWYYLFEEFNEFKFFQDRLKRHEKVEIPKFLENNSMIKRGQMGIYWTSIIH